MLVTSIFFPFPAMFSTLSKTKFAILAIFKSLSANALNLDQSTIVCLVKS